jgi:methylated-DNA-[protein]-cysteine S-methyltransferase
MALAGGGDERLGRIDRRHCGRPQTRHELGSQGTGTTPDVEHPARIDECEVGERTGERYRVASHEAVVGGGCDREAHPTESSFRSYDYADSVAPRNATFAVETPIGRIGVETTEAGLRRVRLPGDAVLTSDAHGDGRAAARAAIAAEQIAEYADGAREQFELELDWAGVDVIHRRVLETLRELAPFGTTVTYGELGQRAGVDDAREVGVMMARNPLPLVVPCHRVVASDGLGGFGGGLDLKRRLLELEGVLPPRLDLGI